MTFSLQHESLDGMSSCIEELEVELEGYHEVSLRHEEMGRHTCLDPESNAGTVCIDYENSVCALAHRW